jgi:hypothetical protein
METTDVQQLIFDQSMTSENDDNMEDFGQKILSWSADDEQRVVRDDE